MAKQSAWLDADGYVRRYLADHAIAGEMLDDLVMQPAYLAIAEPTRLTSVIGQLHDLDAQDVGRLYARVAHRIRDADPRERMALIHLTACQEEPRLARRLEPPMPTRWLCNWAAWIPTTPHRVLLGPTEPIVSMAIARDGNTDVVIAGTAAGQLWTWDAATLELLRRQPVDVGARLESIAAHEVDGRLLVTCLRFLRSRHRELRTVDARSGEVVVARELIDATSAAAGYIGSSLAVVALKSRGRLVILDGETGSQLDWPNTPQGFPWHISSVDKSGSTSLVLGYAPNDWAVLFDLETKEARSSWKTTSGGGYDVFVDIDEERETTAVGALGGRPTCVATGYEDPALVDGEDGRWLGSLATEAEISSVAIGAVDNQPAIALGAVSGNVLLTEARSARKENDPSAPPLFPRSLDAVELGGRPTLAVVAEGQVLAIDARTGQPGSRALRGANGAKVFAIAPILVDGVSCVVVASESTLSFRELETGRRVRPPVRYSGGLRAHSWLRTWVLGPWNSDQGAILVVHAKSAYRYGRYGKPWEYARSGEILTAPGRVWAYDIHTGGLVGGPISGPHGRSVSAAHGGVFEGKEVVLVGTRAGSISIRDARRGRNLDPPVVVPHGGITALEVITTDGLPRVVAGTSSGELWCLDLAPLRLTSQLVSCPGSIRAVAVGTIQGHPVAVAGTDQKEIWLANLDSQEVADPIWCGSSITGLAWVDSGPLIIATENGVLSVSLEGAP